MRRKLAATALALVLLASAGYTASITGGFNFEAFRTAVMGKESARRYHVLNTVTGKAAGAYQFMPATLADLGYTYSPSGIWDWEHTLFTAKSQAMGVSSIEDFLKTEAGRKLQDQAFDEFTIRNWNALSATTKSYIGKTVNGVLITEGGLLSAAHFLGAGGLNKFVAAGFTGTALDNLAKILKQNFPSDPTVQRLDRYVMGRIVSGAAAHGGIAGASGYGGAEGGAPSGPYTAEGVADAAKAGAGTATGVCMSHAILTEPMRVMSPYGVDRSGRARASAGWHQGLDLVNGVGKGDPVYAGVSGRVIVVGSGSGGNRVVVETADGSQRFIFMHLDSIHRDVRQVGATVNPDTQIGTMGDTGSPGAVHLHLGTLMTGDKLKGVGMESRIWASPGGWTGSKMASPLTADQIASALPSTFYFVNPEPFLPSRAEFPASVLSAYASQGISRPDGLTLPNNCSVGSNAISDRVASSFGGVGAGELGDDPLGHMSDVGYAADLAMGEFRDAVVDLTKVAADDFTSNRLYLEERKRPTAVWGALLSGD